MPFSLILFAVFVWAGFSSMEWPPPVRQFPLLITVPGAILALVVTVRDLLELLAANKAVGAWRVTWKKAAEDAWLAEALPFFGYLAGILVLTLLVGQKIAMPVFIGVYLLRWGRYRKRFAAGYALAGWAVLAFFYDQVMGMLFHTSYLAFWLQGVLPSGFPEWLII